MNDPWIMYTLASAHRADLRREAADARLTPHSKRRGRPSSILEGLRAFLGSLV
jgi:hypothetical protein